MTKQLTTQVNQVNSASFTIDLDPGTYIFSYLPDKTGGFDGSSYDGFYTKCAITMQNTDCDEKEEHQLIEVELKQGDTNNEVKLCDWYYQEENKPKF